MKRILLEFIVVVALIIMSGMVLADEYLATAQNNSSNMQQPLQTIDSHLQIYTYNPALNNKLNNTDRVRGHYQNYNRTQLVNGEQVFYAKDQRKHYEIIIL